MLVIQKREEIGQLVLLLEGQFVGLDAIKFKTRIEELIGQSNKPTILNLQAVDQIDLPGFNAVVILNTLLQKQQRDCMLLCTAQSPIHEYIHLSKLSFHILIPKPL